MQWMKTKSLAALGGATLGIVGAVALSAAAGASGLNVGSNPSASPAVVPATASLGAGTYDFLINHSPGGTITLSSANSFTSTIGTNDGGNWVQSGKNIALNVTTGDDQAGNCVFVGKVSSTSAAAGKWVCPGYGSDGTWSVAPEEPAAHPSGHAMLGSATAEPFTFATGSYTLFANGGKVGKIKFVAGNTWTSTVDGGDSGSWVPSGTAFAFSITAAGTTGSGDPGCLFVGTDSTTGLASSAHPGPYVCTGSGVVGDWWAKKK